MTHEKKTNLYGVLLYALGLIICIAPPAVATLTYFPFWRDSDEKAIAGGVLLLLILSAYPLFKWMKRHFSTVASYVLWLILFLLFFSLSKIADEMTVISFIGFVSNLIGALIFYISKRERDKK